MVSQKMVNLLYNTSIKYREAQILPKYVDYILAIAAFAISAFCMQNSEILLSVTTPCFGILVARIVTNGFREYNRKQTAFIVISIIYFSFALITFGLLTFSLSVALMAIASLLLFGQFKIMHYLVTTIGYMSLFFTASYVVSYFSQVGLTDFTKLITTHAIQYPMTAWLVTTIIYGICRMMASASRARFFTQEAFDDYFTRSAKFLLLFQTAVIVLMFFSTVTPTYTSFTLFETITNSFKSYSDSALQAILYLLGIASLTMPYGFVYASFKKKRLIGLSILVALILSALIETLQMVIRNGIFDIDNIILHFAGFLCGMLLYQISGWLTIFFSLGKSKNVFVLNREKSYEHFKNTQTKDKKRKAQRLNEDEWWEAYSKN